MGLPMREDEPWSSHFTFLLVLDHVHESLEMQQCQLRAQTNRAFVGFQEQFGDVDILRREIVETFDEQVTLVIPVGDREKG